MLQTVRKNSSTLYITRHGETDLNIQRRLQGRKDVPLNAAGVGQAEEHRERLAADGICFDAAYTSPLVRAVRTAEIISGLPSEVLRVEPRLIENDFGPFEGRSYVDLDDEMADFFHDPVHVPPPEGVEHIADLIRRVSEFLEELRTDPSVRGNVLISTHGVVMRGMMAYFSDLAWEEVWKIMVGNCETWVVDLADGTYSEPQRYLPEGRRIPVAP